jgi:hypothetical protein
MTRGPRAKADPLEREIELALNPGAFIPDRACFTFVTDLDKVSAGIAKLIDTDPARAVALYETFLAGCYEKAEEVDDSSGDFGQCVDELFCGWVKARQSARADPDETAIRLMGWMDNDPYAFCYHLEKDIAKVFNRAGLAAFVTLIRARFDGAMKMKPGADGGSNENPEYLRRRWGETLRTLYIAQKNVEAYIDLAEENGPTAQDCHAVAALLVTRRQPEGALAWVERGIDLDTKGSHGSMAGHDLAELKRELLVKLGREDEALEAAWTDFRAHPSKYSYDDLMKLVPTAERTAWHHKAIEAATGADLLSRMELLLETKELERLAELVRQCDDPALEGLSHYSAEPAAKKLEKSCPDIAARLWRAQGMRILSAKKSKYYGAALSNFEKAKRCFERAGLASEWEKIVRQVRADHHRKKGFLSGFERLVAGAGPSDEPSFLQRAKARWGGRQRGEKG